MASKQCGSLLQASHIFHPTKKGTLFQKEASV